MARKIMDESPHCALIGEGALEFALSQGIFDEICIPKDLKGEECPIQNLRIPRPEYGTCTDLIYKGTPVTERDMDQQESDSVCAVAMDANGRLACANSTGIIMLYIQAD